VTNRCKRDRNNPKSRRKDAHTTTTTPHIRWQVAPTDRLVSKQANKQLDASTCVGLRCGRRTVGPSDTELSLSCSVALALRDQLMWVNWLEAHLSPRDRAMRQVSWNLANCHEQCRNYLYAKSWTNRSYEVGRPMCNLHVHSVVYWRGIRGYTAYTNLRFFLTAYTHLSDHT